QIDRDKKTLSRFTGQRDRDTEMLKTVTENLTRAFLTNDSIGNDMKRETDRLKKNEEGMRAMIESLRRQMHDEEKIIEMLKTNCSADQNEVDIMTEDEGTRSENAQRRTAEMQLRLNELDRNVSQLETIKMTTDQTLASLKHDLLNTRENYVKDKTYLEEKATNATNQNELSKVRSLN
ncbi:unnamed protein product, partial [Didymodactylos carnosus]